MSEGKCLLDENQHQRYYYYRNLTQQQTNDERRHERSSSARKDEEEDEEERDGANHSHNSNRTTDAQTMMHLLKANIGTGVLAMPLAFKNVGLWFGLVLVPVIGAICIHCMNILIASHNRLCDRFNFESLDYDQVAALGLACGPKWARRFSKRAHIAVTVFLMFTQIGFCCVYTLFTVENLQVAMLNLFSLDYSTSTYLVAVFPVIGLTSCTSNLKHLARISTLANVLQLFGLSLIFFDLLQFHTYSNSALVHGSALANGGGGAQAGEKAIVVQQGLSSDILNGLPLYFATAVYAFEGIGVVLPLIKEMQFPERISGANGVLNTSMSMVAVLYMAVGFFGYAKYGQTVAGSITLNLPESTLNELVRLAFALAIGLSYSLQFYVPWTIVWPLIDESLFYSYRPRVPRDKLDILQKLNKDNHWAITGQDIEEHQREQALRRQQHEKQLQMQQMQLQQQQQQQHEEAEAEQSTTTITVQQQEQELDHGGESTASTLATSYSMSASYNKWYQQSQLAAGSKSASLRQRALQAAASNQYGTMRALKLRNRLDDVMERENSPKQKDGQDEDDDDEDEDSMPEVHWRPPPSSMRGKRKLVRYTVILITVSFTFIAAALIPRLDLFISLIGALASSCLAIIFPAIIQLCTFWNYNEEDENEEELARAADRDTLESERERRRKLEEEANERRAQQRQQQRDNGDKRAKGPSARGAKKSTWTKTRRLKWCLFVAKNCFLLLFGFAGLITGSWVSLTQLGVAGVEV